MTPSSSPESSIIRTYIDLLAELPWYQLSDENIDVNLVEQVLNEDHYGLKKPKERILEYLAVRKYTKSVKSPILCFIGPPGVGKTSLALSIARAINRKFVKISLGGVHDESEIRGHRRTYIGAMPGKIIQGMRKVGVANPVFVLDEIDKLGQDQRGDPASALLEVLDPEQNHLFNDHYLEESFDLSKVLFIATANYIGNIPHALRDRLEIINLSSYTEIEKLHIVKNHLIPKQIKSHELEKETISFSDDAILHIIRYYTKESGVRQLERYIATVCRKIITNFVRSNEKSIKMLVDVEKVREYLGKELFDYTKKEKNNQIGLVNGLAYTDFGGDLIPVEVNYFTGKGRLVITGNLGDVMKESANIGLDYIKANSKKLGIDDTLFDKIDIHIHVPEGAVPKDGPSAGVTMTTAIVSALTNEPVRNDVAMTGEITLRGNVLPIGGLKEKSISAHRAGIKTIVIPHDNEKDLDEIPDIVKENMEIIFADRIEDVLQVALVNSGSNHVSVQN
jgi:ATP-dependent Lon protease